jgi:hemoglobin
MSHQSIVHSAAIVFGSAAVTVATYLAYKQYVAKPQTLLEQVGGEAAVEAAVNVFYKKMLSDDRVKHFFAKTSMAHQVQKQRNFLLYVLDGGNRHKYRGMSMDRAHRKLVRDEGLSDFHFNATAENLNNTFIELGVKDDVRETIMGAVESLREQVLCRGKWTMDDAPAAPEQKTLYDRLGGEKAVEAVVGKFYERMLSDQRVSRFFADTNMVKQHAKQVSFISYVFGSPKKYSGLAMDHAHRRLVKDMGMSDVHFDATKENLDLTLEEVGVPKDLRQEVASLFETLREQVLCRGKWAIPL